MCEDAIQNLLANRLRARLLENNLSNTYDALGRHEDSLRMMRDVYSARVKLDGEESRTTISAAYNCANTLNELERLEEAKSLLGKTVPVARRVFGESHELTLRMRGMYGQLLYKDANATLDDVREAVNTLEEAERIARRVLGGAHPRTVAIVCDLGNARAALREESDVCGAMAAMAPPSA